MTLCSSKSKQCKIGKSNPSLEKLPIGKKESGNDDDGFKNSAAAAAMRSLDDKKD